MLDWIQVALRLLHYATLLALFGLTAFPLRGRGAITWSSTIGRPDKAVVCVAMLAPLLTVALMLSSIAAMMGQPLATLEWATVEALILSTDMGTAFLIRTASLCIAMIALVSGHRTRPTTFIAAICYALALVTLGWSGHAATTEGAPGLFHRLNNAVHLLAAGLWIGAILWFLRLTLEAHRNPLGTPPASLLHALHHFAPLGLLLVGTVAATGIVNADFVFGLDNIPVVRRTGYGWLLLAKIGLFATMLLFATRNAWAVRKPAGKMNPEHQKPRATVTMLSASLAGEIASAIAVIGFVAAMGLKSPIGH